MKIIILLIIVSLIFGVMFIPISGLGAFHAKNACQQTDFGNSTQVKKVAVIEKTIYGKSSWYGQYFHGRKMANGNLFNMYDPTIVAHKTLPFGTILKITNMQNGNVLEGTVQDRGPYVVGRDIDLSYAGAKILGMDEQGVANIKMEILHKS